MDQAQFDELRRCTGRTVTSEDVLTERLAAAFDATLAPALAPSSPPAAPLGCHWCLAPDIVALADLGPDGHPAGGGLIPPIPLPRRMWAGSRIDFLSQLEIGDRIVRRSTLSDMSLKTGRSGLLCFVTVDHEISSRRGAAVRERVTIVCREAATDSPERPTEPAANAADGSPADHVWRITASEILLFRYSALTFNSHRIHYDRPYATATENYPGLLVHGPLQATVLLNMAASLAGSAPRHFSCRGRQPLVAGRDFTVEGRMIEGQAICRTVDADGNVCMEAQAQWSEVGPHPC
jgi:3-methylfumaryl-CoA hydratase